MYKSTKLTHHSEKIKMKLFALFAAFTSALPAYNEISDLAAAPNATEAIKAIESKMAALIQKQDDLNMRHQEVSLIFPFFFSTIVLVQSKRYRRKLHWIQLGRVGF